MENQKKTRVFWIFVISGILVLGGGAYSIYYRINSIAPFLFSFDTDLTDTNPLEQRKKEFAELSIKDSDGDTLSDFSELYINKTSPYIKDSDSDGVDDNVEVEKKTDPLCPTGQDCAGVIATNVNSAVSTSGSTTTEIPTLNATQIRNELSKIGMSQADLNKISDDDLIKLYNDTFSQQSTSTDTEQLNNLQNLNSSQIRDLLQQNGISSEDLKSINDSELQQMYQATVQEQLSNSNVSL